MDNSLVLVIPLLAAGASDDDLRKLQKDVDALRSEVSVLRQVLSEIARSSRQQADLLERLVGGELAETRAPPLPEPAPKVAEKKPDKKADKKSEAPSLAAAVRKAPPKRASARGGTISGSVKVPSGEPVAYVYVENVTGALVSGKRVKMEQASKQFMPGWAVVEKGTEIGFPNKDNIYHNVFSRSPGNTFDLGMYRKGESKSHRFVKPGPVDVYCNIHPRMSASILVVPNRHFTKVQADGSFVLANVPPGRRKVVAWAPGSEAASAWVDLSDAGTSSVQLELGAKGSGHKNKHGQPYGSYP